MRRSSAVVLLLGAVGVAACGRIGFGASALRDDGGGSGADGAVPHPAFAIAGDNDATFVLRDGAVTSWGDGHDGALGTGTNEVVAAPVAASTIAGRVLAITSGLGHACALVEGGGVECWGRDTYSQLGAPGGGAAGQGGDGTGQGHARPTLVPGLGGVLAIAAGDYFTCALRAGDNKVVCWGANDRGQLGNGTLARSMVPVEVPL